MTTSSHPEQLGLERELRYERSRIASLELDLRESIADLVAIQQECADVSKGRGEAEAKIAAAFARLDAQDLEFEKFRLRAATTERELAILRGSRLVRTAQPLMRWYSRLLTLCRRSGR